MSQNGILTHFAPAQRLDLEAIREASRRLSRHLLAPWFNAVPTPVVILDEHRQIVFCNESFRELSRRRSPEEVIGLRPGEALGCVNAEVMDAGCGTSIFCRHCGAATAIVASLRNVPDTQECHLRRKPELGGGALDLQVFARPVEFDGRSYVLFTALDIAHEKRLRYMERTMFHGLVNAAGGVDMIGRMVDMDPDMDKTEVRDLIGDCGRQLLADVLYFRDLAAAETGRLAVSPRKDVDARKVLADLDALVRDRHASEGLALRVGDGPSELLETDPRLLQHVLWNMLLNALEAAGRGSKVVLDCAGDEHSVTFRVSNPGEMPAEVQEQVFKPYFSTKDEHRGLGCHVMQLYGQNHLGGELGFENADGRTTFFLRLPRVFGGKKA